MYLRMNVGDNKSIWNRGTVVDPLYQIVMPRSKISWSNGTENADQVESGP